MAVLIVGGGIAGLTLALTCDQIGVPFHLFEASDKLRPLGLGINLQPHAVRELFDLGLEADLYNIAIATQEYGMFSKYGLNIWTEPRGLKAGYHWPQFSVHRGAFQMLLFNTLLKRAGAACIETGWRATGYTVSDDKAHLHLVDKSGKSHTVSGDVIVGADGIHSAVRAQMQPDEGPPQWGGAVLWRGTSKAKPFRCGASMALAGHATQRIVAYPITAPDTDTGFAVINWIAELTLDPEALWNKEDWNRKANIDDFLPHFAEWRFDWLDVPELVENADAIYEYPMVDRDPINNWTDGRATLMGDAAHAAYPVGSSGASQAIVDARMLGAAFCEHGLSATALSSFETAVLPVANKLVLTNRGSGPDAVLQMVEEKCGGQFDNIENVIPRQQLADHANGYKTIAGFSIETLNQAPSIIGPCTDL